MNDTWPELSFSKGKETYQTIHLWSQIVGKIKLAKMPWINHSWHVSLQVTPVGFTTGVINSERKNFQINFDFLNHQLEIVTSHNELRRFHLFSLSVSGCYHNILTALKEMQIDVRLHPIPSELVDPVPLDKDDRDSYDPDVAAALHLAFLKSQDVLTRFRAGFIGKCSPVHLFWGSFDLTVSRFSGRKAPQHPGGVPNLPDWVTREAYSHEVSSCGFWPGSDALPEAAFYSYIYPEPGGYNTSVVTPGSAYYHGTLGEFILPYEEVRQSSDPNQTLLDFLQSTYKSAADLAKWDRRSLERPHN